MSFRRLIGARWQNHNLPQRLKPLISSGYAARLKSCPDEKLPRSLYEKFNKRLLYSGFLFFGGDDFGKIGDGRKFLQKALEQGQAVLAEIFLRRHHQDGVEKTVHRGAQRSE